MSVSNVGVVCNNGPQVICLLLEDSSSNEAPQVGAALREAGKVAPDVGHEAARDRVAVDLRRGEARGAGRKHGTAVNELRTALYGAHHQYIPSPCREGK